MSGPQLDIDSIEARAQYVHATATGKPYALAEDARLLCAEVRQLRADKRRLEVAVEFRNRRIDELIGQSWAVTSTPEAATGHVRPTPQADRRAAELQRATEQQPCGCARCDERQRKAKLDAGGSFAEYVCRFMIVCPDCGNKRCPRASFHGNDCTRSNKPNQPGSDYQYDRPEIGADVVLLSSKGGEWPVRVIEHSGLPCDLVVEWTGMRPVTALVPGGRSTICLKQLDGWVPVAVDPTTSED